MHVKIVGWNENKYFKIIVFEYGNSDRMHIGLNYLDSRQCAAELFTWPPGGASVSFHGCGSPWWKFLELIFGGAFYRWRGILSNIFTNPNTFVCILVYGRVILFRRHHIVHKLVNFSNGNISANLWPISFLFISNRIYSRQASKRITNQLKRVIG